MKLSCVWNEKMQFDAKTGAHSVRMDAKSPIGNDSGPSPKQLLLASICGCTAMDVAALMRKHKQSMERFEVEADAELTEGSYPVVFKKIHLIFRLAGTLNTETVNEAVKLSQTKFCGVTAMVSKAVPVSYSIEINGQVVGQGEAKFNF